MIRKLIRAGAISSLSLFWLVMSGFNLQIDARQAERLGNAGPWLVFSAHSTVEKSTTDILWAVKPDGSQLTRLAQADLIGALAASPTSHEIAYVTASTGSLEASQPVLNLITLPDGKSNVLTKLTSSKTEPDLHSQERNESIEALMAPDSLAWSPNGNWLAFIGAQVGTSSDVYIFADNTHKITRLTSGPTEVESLNWSPDSKYIVHIGVVEFGSGAGATLDKVWAAAADNSGVLPLYSPEGHEEEILGWVNTSVFVAASWPGSCGVGWHNLRTINGAALVGLPRRKRTGYSASALRDRAALFPWWLMHNWYDAQQAAGNVPFIGFNLQTRTEKMLLANDFIEATFSPTVQKLLIRGFGSDFPCTADGPKPLTGYLYTMSLNQSTPQPLNSDYKATTPYGHYIQWSPQTNAFYAFDGRSTTWLITPDGTISKLPDIFGNPIPSPDGKTQAWIADGQLFIGSVANSVQVNQSVTQAIWVP